MFDWTGSTILEWVTIGYSIELVSKLIALSEFITSESRLVKSFSHDWTNINVKQIIRKMIYDELF